MKTLYFEGAGCVARGDLPNCRIRTAFHLGNGNTVYLEISGMEVTRTTAPCYRDKGLTNYAVIDHCFCIDGTWDDCTNRHYTEHNHTFEYCAAEILAYVNSLGASFDAVEVLPDLAGYRAHAEKGGYNFGDEFAPDRHLIEARQAVDAEIRCREIERGERSICYSLWVDRDDPAILHYKNFRTGEEFDIFVAMPKDPSQLPVLHKSNAVVGGMYAGCGLLLSVYRISDQHAADNHLVYMERCITSNYGDFALPGSDLRGAANV